VRGRSIASDFFLALGEVAQSLMGLFVERVRALLPAAVALDTNLDTSENHLLAPTEIDA
jgi:hypothetical protein